MANERHTDFRGWEIDSSTRQSVHPYTKYKPFRQDLSTSPVDLHTVDRGEIATNWVINPSVVDTDITMYTAVDSTISRSSEQAAWGDTSLKVDPDNSAAGEGFYWESPTIPFSVHPQYLSVQLEHYGTSALSGAVSLEIRAANGLTVLATSGTDDLTTSWRRLTAQYSVPGSTTPAAYRLYLTTVTDHNINFYADKIMFEVREDTTAVSSYLDGNWGINYGWVGTTHASASFKRPAMSVIRGIQIKNESGTSAEIVYLSFDIGSNSTNGIAVLAGATFETNFPIDFRKNVSVVSASGTPKVSGVIWGI